MSVKAARSVVVVVYPKKIGDDFVFFFARQPYQIAAYALASLPRLPPYLVVTHGEEAEGPELDPRRGAGGGVGGFRRSGGL